MASLFVPHQLGLWRTESLQTGPAYGFFIRSSLTRPMENRIIADRPAYGVFNSFLISSAYGEHDHCRQAWPMASLFIPQ